ncbi:MAG: hypothetical protein KA984_02695 [Candidatus Cloacimonetes bacterium]|nr:hypothetical protein [Candidatus Cloacimonadota bacterium]
MTKCSAGLMALAAMLLLLSSCVSSSLIFSEADIGANPNLVFNPSFNPYSTRAEEVLKNWSVHLEPAVADSSPVVMDPHDAHEGNTSLRIDASNKSVMILSDPFPVRRYGGYYLRSFVKTDSPAPPNIYLRLIVFREDGKILNRFRTKNQAAKDWVLATLSAGFLRPGAKFGRLAIMIPPFKEGSVWVDDAGAYEVHGFKID